MLATYVSPRLSPLMFDHAREALAAALRDGERKPSDDVLALALAKCALETGRFQKIWNFNYGNIKAGATYRGMFTCILLNEVIKVGGVDRVVWFAPDGELVGGPTSKLKGAPLPVPNGHPQTRMRVHANHFDGAFEYVDFLRKRPAMWSALQLGEPIAFVSALKRGGYFTAPEAAYSKAVASLFREFRLKLEGKSPDATRLPEPEWVAARGCARLVMAEAARHAVDVARADRG